ncbi:helix-turn-helix transcriptional regulator [Alloalcanivorax xenomutans]|uniref:AraC family transcriptional regulator n=1 Tax=Alloalcanivorax xenomutans TaxID=1094342 RepID=A0A9Q3ZHN3_9GAMM|nr:AraC family transcriptional regulator [Alloalcanivorax xenomutans]MCE7509207.1 AraC family transcriptional regulator [Alloalcanivorax xenomutans]
MNHFHVAHLWVSGLLQAFEKVGLDTRQLGTGIREIREGQIIDGHHLGIEATRTLWHRASAISNNPLLGIDVARRQSPRTGGVLLPIMLHSPTALQALRHMVDYQPLLSDSGQYRIHPLSANRLIRCEYVPAPGAVVVSNQQVLSIVTQTLGLLRTVTNHRLQVRRFLVPEGMAAERIGQALNCPCRAHSGNFFLEIDGQATAAPVSERDEHLYQINLSYAEGLIRAKRRRQTFIDGIKELIDDDRPALRTIDDVALALGLHKRVLQRHLREHDTSFRQLKISVLKTRALQRMIVQGWRTDAIAEELGYADLSAFHRAFKNWFGVSPRRFREQPYE